MAKKLVVGLDFDGVVAYNPARLIRAPIKWIKRKVWGIKKLTFFTPKNPWEKFLWMMVHESSIWPANGMKELIKLVQNDQIEAHLVTARYQILEKNLYDWLERYQVRDIFKTVNVNLKNEQPHLFKERMVKKYKFDYYIEDNFDIVEYLEGKRTRTKVYWIYNILDLGRVYAYKFPFLKKALEALPL